jgi:hypothetical protein
MSFSVSCVISRCPKEAVDVNYLIDFDRYFAAELEAMRPSGTMVQWSSGPTGFA